MDVTLKVSGKPVAQGQMPAAMSLHFTGGNESFDIASDEGSPVSFDYFDQTPFKFNGTIGATKIAYLKKIKDHQSETQLNRTNINNQP